MCSEYIVFSYKSDSPTEFFVLLHTNSYFATKTKRI